MLLIPPGFPASVATPPFSSKPHTGLRPGALRITLWFCSTLTLVPYPLLASRSPPTAAGSPALVAAS
jgi:hypothetical protein